MSTPDNTPLTRTRSTRLVERDRRKPLVDATLRALDPIIDVKEEGGDIVRMYFVVGIALLQFTEVYDCDRNVWIEGMVLIGDTIFGDHPEHPDIAEMLQVFRDAMKRVARERRRTLQ
jgi:hypothetical protein